MKKNTAQLNSFIIVKLLMCFILCSFYTPIHAQNFEIKVACIGNSITEGFGRENPDSYPNQLDKLLGDKYNVRNFGIGSRTLLKKGDYPYWDEDIFLLAQDFQPDIVIILLGTNDSWDQNWVYKDEFYSDYIEMVNVFRNLNSYPEIFVGFPPPAFGSGFVTADSRIHYEIIPLIDLVRTTLHTFHINFYNAMIEMGDLFPDGIHPNAEGYGEMARIAADAIINRPSGVIKYFYANPTVIEEDETATLFWEASDSSVVTLDNQVVGVKDSLFVFPFETTEYTLIASGEFQDTSIVQITFLPSGLIKSFYAKSPMLEKDVGDSTVLYWGTTNNSQVWLDGEAVSQHDSIVISPGETKTYTLIANGVEKDTSQVAVTVFPADEINRSLLALSYSASSTEYRYSVESAFDEDTLTYWLSVGHAAEWISADLGKELYINRIKINWGDVFASLYRIEILDEAGTMSVFNTTTTGDGEIDEIEGEPVKGRLVRILCLKSSSNSEGYKINEFEIYGTSKAGESAVAQLPIAPENFNLLQNYPNPFNSSTVIRYHLLVASRIDISIYNSVGQKITTLVSEKQRAGNHVVTWTTTSSDRIASGVYLCKLSMNKGKTQTRKLILLK